MEAGLDREIGVVNQVRIELDAGTCGWATEEIDKTAFARHLHGALPCLGCSDGFADYVGTSAFGSQSAGCCDRVGYVGEAYDLRGTEVFCRGDLVFALDDGDHVHSAELGEMCVSLPQDVSTVEGCKALAAAYARHEQRLDILVNNAGAAWGAAFDDFPESGWDKVMNLNLKSPFFLTQAFAPSSRMSAPCAVAVVMSIFGCAPPPGSENIQAEPAPTVTRSA